MSLDPGDFFDFLLNELAVHLNAAAGWLRDLAIAAERPGTPIELGDNVRERLATLSDHAG
jgi:hypothetical protein